MGNGSLSPAEQVAADLGLLQTDPGSDPALVQSLSNRVAIAVAPLLGNPDAMADFADNPGSFADDPEFDPEA